MTTKPTTSRSLKEYIGVDQVVTLAEQAEIMKVKKLETVFKVSANLPQLDHLLEGFEAGELVVVSGPAKNGKSLFCQTLTCQFSRQGIITLWFSYELTLRQFIARFPGKLPDVCLPAKMTDNTLLWIEDRIQEGIEKFGIKVVFIDHLHFIVDMERLRNPSLEIGVVLRGLKHIAIKHGIVIFLVAHIGKVEDGKRPTAANLRDSSFLTQEPDTVLMIWRRKETKDGANDNRANVSVEMSRRTGVFNKKFQMVKVDGLLREVPKEDVDRTKSGKGDDDD